MLFSLKVVNFFNCGIPTKQEFEKFYYIYEIAKLKGVQLQRTSNEQSEVIRGY